MPSVVTTTPEVQYSVVPDPVQSVVASTPVEVAPVVPSVVVPDASAVVPSVIAPDASSVMVPQLIQLWYLHKNHQYHQLVQQEQVLFWMKISKKVDQYMMNLLKIDIEDLDLDVLKYTLL